MDNRNARALQFGKTQAPHGFGNGADPGDA